MIIRLLVLAILSLPTGFFVVAQQMMPAYQLKDSLIQLKSDKSPYDEGVYIIILKAEPLSAVKREKHASRQEISDGVRKIKDEQEHLMDEIRSIEVNQALAPGGKTSGKVSLLENRYRNSVNGVAIKTSKWVADKLKSLDFVKGVYENATYKIDLSESTHIIGADSIWINYGYYGDSVVIAIIDTGIDYLHPDLGGGIGPGFKVIGGINCINSENPPMDDNGHGTHVAGIAAANGNIRGVAPHASLMAIKALQSDGTGISTWILAGIEFALDPDNDPFTDDQVDIINMSFGGTPDFYDLIAPAVNNAVSVGVICVAAAGNEGPGYRTLSTPGVAEKAITVGSATKSDNMAGSSSRGPAKLNYCTKPDIAAPGVNINSTLAGGGYGTMSGTSMAAPHVSGSAALLLQQHPDWTPRMVKASLMNSCKDIGSDIWTQGNGRLNIFKAVRSRILVSPGSFTLVDMAPAYIYYDTVLITNNDTLPLDFDMMLSQDSPDNIAVVFSPPNGTVLPGQQVTVAFALNVSSVPDVDIQNSTWLPYSGSIVVATFNDSIKVNYSFIKHPYLQVFSDYTDRPLAFSDTGDGSWFLADRINGNKYTYYVEPGLYHVFLQSPDYLALKENIPVDPVGTTTIDFSIATNQLMFQFLDEKGDAAPVKINTYTFLLHDTIPFYDNFIQDMDLHFSPVSDKFKVAYRSFTDPSLDKVYYYNGIVNDLTQSHTLTNQPSDLKSICNDMAGSTFKNNIVIQQFFGNDKFATGVNWNTSLQKPFSQQLFMIPETLEENRFPDHLFRYTYDSPLNLFSMLPDLRYRNLHWEFHFQRDNRKNILNYYGDEIINQLGPTHFFGKFQNENMVIRLQSNTDWGYGPYFFLHQFQDYAETNYQYMLHDASNNLLDSNRVWCRMTQIQPPVWNHFICYLPYAGQFYLTLTDTSSFVYNRRAMVTARNGFNTTHADKNPPTIASFNIGVNDDFTDRVYSSQSSSRIMFVVEDDRAIKNVSLFIKKETDTTWLNLPIVHNDSIFTAGIHDQVGCEYSGYFDVRILASDSSDNFLEQTSCPGFYYKAGPVPPVILRPASFDTTPMIPLFNWTPVESAVSYQLQIASGITFSNIVYDTLVGDTTYTLTDAALVNNWIYYARVRAIDSCGESLWSKLAPFVTEPDTTVPLPAPPVINSPLCNEIINSTNPDFAWSPGDSITHSYDYRMARVSNFDDNELFSNINCIPDTTYSYAGIPLSKATKYFFRVRSRNAGGNSIWQNCPFITEKYPLALNQDASTSLLYPFNCYGGSIKLNFQNNTYIQFNCTPWNGLYTIAASLRLYVLELCSTIYDATHNDCLANEYGIYEVLRPWNENTITWDNQPDSISGLIGAFSTADWSFYQQKTIDIDASVVQKWIEHPSLNNGLVIKPLNPPPFFYRTRSAASFYWQNPSWNPTLIISSMNTTREIKNDTVFSDQTECYDASQTITTAGNGTVFIVKSGGSTTMVAGENIIYLPSTTVQSGGYLRGYIAPDGPWCNTPALPGAATAQEETPGRSEKSSFKIYPNPTTGNFILELTGEKPASNVTMDIYGMRGDKILSALLTGQHRHEFSLSGRPAGVYFIRVVSGDKSETVKVIKQ